MGLFDSLTVRSNSEDIEASWFNSIRTILNSVFDTYILNNITDVTIDTPIDKQVLTYETSSGLWKNVSTVIDDIDDVVITAPANNDVLTYNTASGDWINQSTAASSGYQLGSIQKFTANGTWTKPAGVLAVVCEVVGSGGAGGAGSSTAAGAMSCASGGGGGGYASKFITSGLGATETITVGVGGTGSAGNDGNAGNTTSFGTHLQATGGAGGIHSTASSGGRIAQGVAGGVGTLGDVNSKGGSSDSASSDGTTARGTAGGASFFGGGGNGRAATLASGSVSGIAAGDYGGGGSGTCNGQSSTSTAGGAGSDGLVVVYEYY